MKKKQLRKILKTIVNEYKLTKYGEGYVGECWEDVEDHVQCLKNKNLAQYLYDVSLCPGKEEVEAGLQEYGSASGIIEQFIIMMQSMEHQLGFLESKKTYHHSNDLILTEEELGEIEIGTPPVPTVSNINIPKDLFEKLIGNTIDCLNRAISNGNDDLFSAHKLEAERCDQIREEYKHKKKY